MPQFLFITGSHKSGTSWLARMVGAHPRIAIPEQEMWLLGHNNGLSECVERSVAEWFKLPTVKSQFPTKKDMNIATKKIMRGALRGAIDASVSGLKGIEVLGDKTPAFYAENAKRLKWLYPDAHYVQIVRDPRDVVVSHHFHAYRLKEWKFFHDTEKAQQVQSRIEAGESVGHELLDEGALQRNLRNWMRVQQRGIDAENLFPGRYYMLRYEDLLVDAAPHLQTIFSLTGVPLEAPQIEEIVGRFSFENMTRGRSAGEEDASSFFRKGVSGDWNNYFTAEQNAYVWEKAGELMRRFEYTDEA
ncbi:MAG: sulfotransferase [Roseovarius sp.]